MLQRLLFDQHLFSLLNLLKLVKFYSLIITGFLTFTLYEFVMLLVKNKKQQQSVVQRL